MPLLIADVTNYVKDQTWRSLGATRLVGDRMDDYWIENGADLWRDFGIFMRLPEGSRVAQWFREGASAEPPIVLIGSEGEQEILAPNLEAFLAAWALGGFNAAGDFVANGVSVGMPSDMIRSEEYEADVADGRPAFAKFLTQRLGRDIASFVAQKPADDDFKAFFDAWQKTALAEMAANAHLREIVRILDADIPRGKEPWERVSFRIAAIGERIEIGSKGDPRQLLLEATAAALRPVIVAERERRASGVHAPRGLWHSAAINLYPTGQCQLNVDWAAEPQFVSGPAPVRAEFALDQQRFPKSDRWLEPWIKTLL